jgi:arylsulfatase
VSGVLLAQGGATGGWSLRVDGGVPSYRYAVDGDERYEIVGKEPVPPGVHRLRLQFCADRRPGRGATVALYVDGRQVGIGRVDRTDAGTSSGTSAVGMAVDPTAPDAFTGTIERLRVETGGCDDHRNPAGAAPASVEGHGSQPPEPARAGRGRVP